MIVALATALGAGILHALWMGPLVAGAAAALASAVPATHPRPRLWILTAALIASAVLPIALSRTTWLPHAPWMGALPAVWAAGLGLFLVRFANSLRAVTRMRRRAAPAGAAWQARLDACATAIGVSQRVVLLVSPDRETPCTLGAWRPAIVLPVSRLSHLSHDAWQAVVMHELAHVRRHDYAWHALQSLVAAATWHQPAAYWLSRAIAREREAACDGLAAKHADAEVLVAALLGLEARRERAASATGSGLRDRAERLLPSKPALSWRRLSATVALASCTVAAVVYAAASMHGPGDAATSWAAALALGVVIGLRHAFEPDHLAAVATLVTRRQTVTAAAGLGASWGVGHTLSLCVVGSLLVLARRAMPESLGVAFELVVGLMLIGMGLRALHRAWAMARGGSVETHEHGGRAHTHATAGAHIHVGAFALAPRPLMVGLVHGLAGSGALTALAVASLPSWPQQLVLMLVFGVGSTLGMALVTAVAGWPLARAFRSALAWPALSAATGVLALAVGTLWTVPIVVSQLSR